MPPASHLETAFALWLRQHPSIPEPETEYQFHPQRKWRLDMAWPDQMVAVEIEGITYDGGRHQRVAGFLADAEKYEAAMLAGLDRLPRARTVGCRRFPHDLARTGYRHAETTFGSERMIWLWPKHRPGQAQFVYFYQHTRICAPIRFQNIVRQGA